MSEALYVHVPFCNHICAYCDFTRCGYYEPLAKQWLVALERELQKKKPASCKTIYIGGGTPSALSYEQLQRLLEALKAYANEVTEYTIEANADSFDEDKIKLCKAYGVNRISLGAQSFDHKLLKRMGRLADYEMISACIAQLREAGITNISLDMMYGLPDQTMEVWVQDLHKAMALPITHLSLYSLTIEEHSQFGREHVSPCDEDLEADFYEQALQICEENGFEHYEISSFARNQLYSMHNLAYWHYDDFCGVGCGASGKEKHIRYDNTRNLQTYLEKGPMARHTLLSKEDEMFEMMMMGLRLKEGVSAKLFQKRFAQDYHDVFQMGITKHIKAGNLADQNGYLRTTKQGMMLLHEILVDFL